MQVTTEFLLKFGVLWMVLCWYYAFRWRHKK